MDRNMCFLHFCVAALLLLAKTQSSDVADNVTMHTDWKVLPVDEKCKISERVNLKLEAIVTSKESGIITVRHHVNKTTCFEQCCEMMRTEHKCNAVNFLKTDTGFDCRLAYCHPWSACIWSQRLGSVSARLSHDGVLPAVAFETADKATTTTAKPETATSKSSTSTSGQQATTTTATTTTEDAREIQHTATILTHPPTQPASHRASDLKANHNDHKRGIQTKSALIGCSIIAIIGIIAFVSIRFISNKVRGYKQIDEKPLMGTTSGY